MKDKEDSFFLLYELLVEGSSLSLPIYVKYNGNLYSTTTIPEKVLKAKIQLNNIINLEQTNNYKKIIKEGFKDLKCSQNLYTKIYFAYNLETKLIGSKLIQKIYNFLSVSKNSIIYINNMKITKKDLGSSCTAFSKNILEKFEPNFVKENSKTISLFKKIDILTNLLNLDTNYNLESLKENAVFKRINIA